MRTIFEYKVFKIAVEDSNLLRSGYEFISQEERTLIKLNELGLDGWELCHMYRPASSYVNGLRYQRVVMKRVIT